MAVFSVLGDLRREGGREGEGGKEGGRKLLILMSVLTCRKKTGKERERERRPVCEAYL